MSERATPPSSTEIPDAVVKQAFEASLRLATEYKMLDDGDESHVTPEIRYARALELTRAAIRQAILADRESSRAEIERLNAELIETSRRAALAKRRETTARKFWIRDAKEALAGKHGALRNRVELCELPPVRMERDPLDGSALLVFDEQQQKAEDDEISRLMQERDHARDWTWFWQIVDENGLANVPSDERGALRELCNAIERLTKARDEAISALSIAEQATKTALESIPIAMTAAAEKERDACAKIIDDQSPHLNGAISSAICASLAAAIRNRSEEK